MNLSTAPRFIPDDTVAPADEVALTMRESLLRGLGEDVDSVAVIQRQRGGLSSPKWPRLW